MASYLKTVVVKQRVVEKDKLGKMYLFVDRKEDAIRAVETATLSDDWREGCHPKQSHGGADTRGERGL